MTFETPQSLDDAHAAPALIPSTLPTAAFSKRGCLAVGETVLVHAVQLASAKGLRVIAMARGPDKVPWSDSRGLRVI
jgi:hypothetical protein